MNSSIFDSVAQRQSRNLLALATLGASFFGGEVLRAQVVIPKFQMQVLTTTKLNDGNVATYDGLSQVNQAVYVPEFGSTEEFGAQLTLNTGGGVNPVNVFKGLSFYYFSNYSVPGGLTYRIYANNGPTAFGRTAPGDFLYEFNTDLAGSSSGTITKQSVGIGFNSTLTLPTTITVTAQFAGLDSTHIAGLMLTDGAPAQGSQAPVFWYTLNEGNTWVFSTLIPVPEPNSAVCVGAVLGIFGVVRALARRSR